MDNPNKTDPNDPRDTHLNRITGEVLDLIGASRTVGASMSKPGGVFYDAVDNEQAARERLMFSILNALRDRKDG